MTLSKKEIKFIHNRHVANAAALLAMLFIIFGPPALARSEENIGKDEPINYIHLETQRVIKLQEENRFLLQRINKMNEKVEAMQAEMLSVRNAYLEREDIIPRTQKEVSERYEEKISLLQEEIQQLKKDLADQRNATEVLDAQRSLIQGDLSDAAQSKGELQATIERLEVECDALAQKTNEQSELQEKLAQAKQKHEEELARINEQTERLKKENEALAASSSSSLKASEQEHEMKAKELEKKIEELARSRDEDTKALNKEKEVLQAQLKEAQERTVSIENGKEKLAREINEIKALLDERQIKVTSLEGALKTKDSEIAKLLEASQTMAQNATETSVKLAEKQREFESKLAALDEADKKAAQEHAQALEGLKADLAQKDSQVASLKSEKENDTQPLVQKIDELEGKLGFASQQNKEFQEKANTLAQLNSTLEQRLKEATNAAVSASGEQVALLEKKVEELRGKIQDDELELKSALNENELLLSELLASKDDRIKLNNEINELNKSIFALKDSQLSAADSLPQETQETMSQLTRELLTTENTVYEKELIIEGLRSDQSKLERALALSQDNYDMLKAELEGLKVNEVSYNGRDSVLDLELNKLEERVERQLMEH